MQCFGIDKGSKIDVLWERYGTPQPEFASLLSLSDIICSGEFMFMIWIG
jgi:hypothetical protein